MDTLTTIKEKALTLFNSRGVMNVTLREVAKELDKSYGNITYYYSTKDKVIEELYNDMVAELNGVTGVIMEGRNLFEEILRATLYTFDLSIRYIFLFKDYVEIKRNFLGVAEKVEKSNTKRKRVLKKVLIILQEQGILRPHLKSDDLDYLMELSGAIRTFFFLNLSEKELKRKNLKQQYLSNTNRLLIPYLTPKGIKLYEGVKYEG